MNTGSVIEFPRKDEMQIEQAAAYLGISVGTLRNRIWQGLGPRRLKRFKRLLFLKEDLDSYISIFSREWKECSK